MTIHNNYYGSNATPPETICPHLSHDLSRHLQRHDTTPDPLLIKRILFRRGIGDEADLIRSYGPETPYAKFLTEYRTEICKVHLL